MNSLEDRRAQLTRKMTELTEMRSLYMTRYGPILNDRNERGEIERKLRSLEKPFHAYNHAVMKLGMVREELKNPPPPITKPDPEGRLKAAVAFHRASLAHEERRQVQLVADLKPTADLVKDLNERLSELRPEDPELEKLVEDVQQEYNITQEELRVVEAMINEGGQP